MPSLGGLDSLAAPEERTYSKVFWSNVVRGDFELKLFCSPTHGPGGLAALQRYVDTFSKILGATWEGEDFLEVKRGL